MTKNIKLLILYGSQTGNAQDLAERIWRKAKKLQISAKLSSFDRSNLSELINTRIKNEETVLLCVCSTTGQGDHPDNMRIFWSTVMRKSVPIDILSDLEFGVIGLGDSSYEKYNFTAKKLHKRFVQLGAKPLLDVCLCDEQNGDGIEGTYSRWINKFWELVKNYDLDDLSRAKSKITKYQIMFDSSEVDGNQINGLNISKATERHPYFAKMINNIRITHKDHWQDVRLIEFDCSNTHLLDYEAGDVLGLRPSNLKFNIDKFFEVFQHLNLDSSQKIRILPNYENEIEMENEIELVHTVGDLIERYFDLNSIPRMSFFEMFSELATDELEKEKLEEFLTPEGLDDLYNYCYRPRRSLIEIFYDFPKTSKNITDIKTLIDLIPSMKPRYFSIASSPHVHKGKIQILVAIVEYKTRLHESRKGTCSYWLNTLKPNESDIRIPIWIKKGSFKIDWSKPILCIGPGTGVAPFRSIINERIFKYDQKNNHLYFGCRSEQSDYYFKDEWLQIQDFKKEDDYLHVNVAFSRDQEQKIYVQDKLLENSAQVFHLLQNLECTIFIAGNSKRMPEDVLAILERIVKEHLSKNTNETNVDDSSLEMSAKNFIKNLEMKKRIQLETWS